MHHHPPSDRVAAISAVATALIVLACLAVPTLAEDLGTQLSAAGAAVGVAPTPAPKCLVQSDISDFDLPLPRLAFRIAAGLPLKIVAIGSSSTYGAGASS